MSVETAREKLLALAYAASDAASVQYNIRMDRSLSNSVRTDAMVQEAMYLGMQQAFMYVRNNGSIPNGGAGDFPQLRDVITRAEAK